MKMNNQSNADILHSQEVLLRMQEKTTEELQSIWQENDKGKWSKEDFDAIQRILMERIGKLPEQKVVEKNKTPSE
jgi:predicted transcriptional regulator